jgi:uncharacterized protein
VPASLFDANIWVAATFPTHPFHAPALTALEAATPDAPAVFCRATQVSFLRLATTPQLLKQYGARGFTNDDVLAGLQILLSRPSVAEMDEPLGTAALWLRLASRDTASPKVWMDAYLAAFAICGEMRLVSLDHDFKAYRAHGLDLAVLNP